MVLSVKMKGGVAGWLVKLVVIILLALIACLLYQSWVMLTTMQMFSDAGQPADFGKNLTGLVGGINELFKRVIDNFI